MSLFCLGSLFLFLSLSSSFFYLVLSLAFYKFYLHFLPLVSFPFSPNHSSPALVPLFSISPLLPLSFVSLHLFLPFCPFPFLCIFTPSILRWNGAHFALTISPADTAGNLHWDSPSKKRVLHKKHEILNHRDRMQLFTSRWLRLDFGCFLIVRRKILGEREPLILQACVIWIYVCLVNSKCEKVCFINKFVYIRDVCRMAETRFFHTLQDP